MSREDLVRLQVRSRLMAAELPRVGRIRLGLYSGTGDADEGVLEAARRDEVSLFGPHDLV